MNILLWIYPTVTFYRKLLVVLLASSLNAQCLSNVLEPKFRVYSQNTLPSWEPPLRRRWAGCEGYGQVSRVGWTGGTDPRLFWNVLAEDLNQPRRGCETITGWPYWLLTHPCEKWMSRSHSAHFTDGHMGTWRKFSSQGHQRLIQRARTRTETSTSQEALGCSNMRIFSGETLSFRPFKNLRSARGRRGYI